MTGGTPWSVDQSKASAHDRVAPHVSVLLWIMFWIRLIFNIKIYSRNDYSDLNFKKSLPDENILYIKVCQKNTTNNNTLSVCLPHPPNASNINTPFSRA